jgi:prophage regulatory protein
MQFLRVRKVTEMVGFSKTTLYARVRNGTFPKPIVIGPQTVAFLESDVLEWMQRQISQTRPHSSCRHERAVHAAKTGKALRSRMEDAT